MSLLISDKRNGIAAKKGCVLLTILQLKQIEKSSFRGTQSTHYE